MAKTNWEIGETVQHTDMNDIGTEINTAQATADAAETPAGAQAKADQAEANAVESSYQRVAKFKNDDGSQIDPDVTTESLILTAHENTPDVSGNTYYYIQTHFSFNVNGNKAQIATLYKEGNEMYMRNKHETDPWSAWTKVTTENDVIEPTAENTSIGDSAGNFTATDVEGALKELHDTKETPTGAQSKANDAEASAKTYADTTKLAKTGGTVTGNLTIDAGTNTMVTIKAQNFGNATLALHGDAQSTGRVYVGQSETYGGGFEYNGDGDPVTTDAPMDHVTFFRRDAGVDTWVMKYSHNKDTVDLKGNLTWNNGTDSLDDLKTSVSDGKSKIATAITDAGGTASGSDTFQELATVISGLNQLQSTPTTQGIYVNQTTITDDDFHEIFTITGGYTIYNFVLSSAKESGTLSGNMYRISKRRGYVNHESNNTSRIKIKVGDEKYTLCRFEDDFIFQSFTIFIIENKMILIGNFYYEDDENDSDLIGYYDTIFTQEGIKDKDITFGIDSYLPISFKADIDALVFKF
ncbi:hypothetical protein [Longirhabdus pacifica]|uniref:hypothetical protein n=1 Tax=Longirhabdus pacifica TaxID=2305227 RepID=UPI0010086EEE|nr:hypothetical protein [Longirhabdus pacifica]